MKIVVFVLTSLIAVILFIVYDKISKPDIETIPATKQNITKVETKEDTLKLSFSSHAFPAREMFMKIDFREYKKIILYKVTIDANDEYALFNIKAILENEAIAYSMLEKEKTQIFILFRSLAQANRIIRLFQSYHFDIKFKKIIKRI